MISGGTEQCTGVACDCKDGYAATAYVMPFSAERCVLRVVLGAAAGHADHALQLQQPPDLRERLPDALRLDALVAASLNQEGRGAVRLTVELHLSAVADEPEVVIVSGMLDTQPVDSECGVRLAQRCKQLVHGCRRVALHGKRLPNSTAAMPLAIVPMMTALFACDMLRSCSA